jgi:hypothetical protein|tara:strand:+ start:939 stop:1100 length:162 start_codon:yes stop_codon:yes gene_type:complete
MIKKTLGYILIVSPIVAMIIWAVPTIPAGDLVILGKLAIALGMVALGIHLINS